MLGGTDISQILDLYVLCCVCSFMCTLRRSHMHPHMRDRGGEAFVVSELVDRGKRGVHHDVVAQGQCCSCIARGDHMSTSTKTSTRDLDCYLPPEKSEQKSERKSERESDSDLRVS